MVSPAFLHARQTFQSLATTTTLLSLSAVGLWATFNEKVPLSFDWGEVSALEGAAYDLPISAETQTQKPLNLKAKLKASQQAVAWLTSSDIFESRGAAPNRPYDKALVAAYLNATQSVDQTVQIAAKARFAQTAYLAQLANFKGSQSGLTPRSMFTALATSAKPHLIMASVGGTGSAEGRVDDKESDKTMADTVLAKTATSALRPEPSDNLVTKADTKTQSLPQQTVALKQADDGVKVLSTKVLNFEKHPLKDEAPKALVAELKAAPLMPLPKANPLRAKPQSKAKDNQASGAVVASLQPMVGGTRLAEPRANKLEPFASVKKAYQKAFDGAAGKINPDGTLMHSVRDKRCLAEAIYFESRGEPIKGQQAVAQVVINRVVSDLYPDNICDVVYQQKERLNSCQFSFACDGIPERITDKATWKQAQDIAATMLSSKAPLTAATSQSTHYHANYVNPSWVTAMTKVSSVGQHIFYEICWSCEAKQGTKTKRRKVKASSKKSKKYTMSALFKMQERNAKR